MARARKAYTAEFSLQAVTMNTDRKLSAAKVARRLGVGGSLRHAGKKAIREKGVGAFRR